MVNSMSMHSYIVSSWAQCGCYRVPLPFYNKLRDTATTPKAASDTGVAQILIFIIYKIFNKIYIFGNVVFKILATQKYFWGYLQCLDMVCLSIQKHNNDTSLISTTCNIGVIHEALYIDLQLLTNYLKKTGNSMLFLIIMNLILLKLQRVYHRVLFWALCYSA